MARQAKLNTPEKRARVGERIKVAATQSGYSLKELAELAGTSPSMIYQYVRGIISIPLDLLERIALVTRVHSDFFDPEKDARATFALPAEATEAERALSARPEPGTRSRIEAEMNYLRQLSEAYYYPKRNRSAYISSLEQMLSLARTLGNHVQEAWVLWQLGVTKIEMNDLAEAKRNILAARDIFAAEGKDNLRANATLDLSVALNEEGAFEAANAYLEEIQDHPDPGVRWRVLTALGTLRYRQHDMAGALRHFCSAAEQLEHVSPEEREGEGMLQLMINLADVVRATGHYEGATLLWSRCLQQATHERRADVFLESMLEIAQCCYIMGRIGEAKQRLELAVVLAGFLFEDEVRLSVARAQLADLLVKMGSMDEARDHARVALRIANRVRRPRSTIVADLALAETNLASGLWKDALEYAQEVIDEGKRTKRTIDMSRARELRARCYLRGQEDYMDAGADAQATEALGNAFNEVEIAIELAVKADSVLEHIGALLTRARCYLRQGNDAAAGEDARAVLALTEEGAVGLQRLLGDDADRIPPLLRSEAIDLPTLFSGRRLNMAALEWQAGYIHGTLEAKRHGKGAGFPALRDAAAMVTQILSSLTQQEAAAFQKRNPEVAAVFQDMARYAITDSDKNESRALLETASWMKPDSNLPALLRGPGK
jgi:transcriptional regulator with XRE-family HTH domain